MKQRRRRNPASMLSEMTPFLLGAAGLIAILYVAKKLSGTPATLPGP